MGANFLIKLIMLFFYRRIFNVMGRGFNICNWVFIWLSVVWFIYAVLSWLFYCGTHFKENFEGGWLVCPKWGFEIQMGVFALDSFIDLGLLIMPIPFVCTFTQLSYCPQSSANTELHRFGVSNSTSSAKLQSPSSFYWVACQYLPILS